MTTLVTGGTGFLGRHLVGRLLRAGESVRVLTRSFDRALSERGVEIVEGSIQQSDDVRRAVDGADRIFHLAGKVERRREHTHEMYELHVDGTRRLLEAARSSEIEKIVVASTSGTVGVSERPDAVATEETETKESLLRDWPYYLSKIYAERVCEEYVRDYDLPIVTMRPTLFLGPGDWRGSSTNDVVLFLQGKIPGTMSGGLSFVDVRDAAEGFRLAMEKAEPGEMYLLGQANMTVRDFFERLETISGVSAPKLPLPDPLMVAGSKLLDSASRALGRETEIDPVSVEMAQYYWYIDSSKAERELGWTPRNPMETLRDTVRWIRKHRPEFSDDQSTDRPAPPSEFVPDETVAYARELSDRPRDASNHANSTEPSQHVDQTDHGDSRS